jgi:hypothetical protein
MPTSDFSANSPATGRKIADRHRLRRAIVVTLLGSALALAQALVLVSVANAGTYVIDNCPSAPTGNGNPGPWTVFGASQNTKGSCSGGPGSWIGPEGASMPPTGAGDLDGVQVVVPAGSAITIREAKVWWYVPHQISGATTYAIASVNTGIVEESGTTKNSSLAPDVFVLPSTTTELTLADYCSNSDAGNGCNFGEGESPNLELFGASLTLFDPGLPSGSVTGGSLAGSGPASGTESLAYNASDGGSGVRYVELLIDGKSVAKNDYIAECPYQNFAACPPNVSGTISWNTGGVADGQHEVALRIVNAGGNSSIVDDHTITTQNASAPVSPLGALPGPGTGAGGSAGVGASRASGAGAANGTSASEAAQLRLGVPPTILRSFAHRALRVTGRLLNDLGDPIGNATLAIVQQIAGSSRTQVIAYAKTQANGTFAVRVPAGPSRLVEVAYRAFSADASYAAQAKIEESVRAGVELNINPRRTNPSGTITLTGKVQGPIPPQGTILDLLVHYRGRWEPFRTPRTSANGRFRVVYQFEGGVGRFPFRAEVPAGQAGFPFVGGYSVVVDVSTG